MMDHATEEFVAEVSALYRRARDGQLTARDVYRTDEVTAKSPERHLEKIYRDKARFELALGEFGATYDIFRAFTGDQLVLDVGAHWGYSAVAMRHQGCTARIHSIEAMPFNIPSLRRLQEIENGNYSYSEAAASDSVAVVRFYVPVLNGVANTGLATRGATLNDRFARYLASKRDTTTQETGEKDRVGLLILEVSAEPIDLIVERDLGRTREIAAIKLDIEGHEPAAIRGARRTLSEFAPLVMTEDANRNPEVVALMSEYGYRHHVRRGGQLHLHQAPSDDQDGFRIHPTRLAVYRELGIVADRADSN